MVITLGPRGHERSLAGGSGGRLPEASLRAGTVLRVESGIPETMRKAFFASVATRDRHLRAQLEADGVDWALGA